MICKGIDTSVYNGFVDFNKVKAAGYSFAMIRCGYGDMISYPNQIDSRFEQSYRNAKAAGMNLGCYFYSYSTTVEGAKREAEGVLNVIKGKQFDYPIALDIEEDDQMQLPANQKAAVIETFISMLEKAGYYVVLYSFESFLNTVPITTLAKYDIWCANIDKKPSIRYGIWQNSWVGKVNGINGDVDTDIAEKDYPAIIKGAGLNGYPKTNTNSKINNTKVKADTITPFDKYFAERIGVGIDYDGNGVYCFDLANDYSINLIGGKQFWGDGAYEIYTNFDNQPGKELYERIPNTPEFVPIKGDIMVWGQGIGQWGHVAICTGEGDTTWFNSYDQNWGGKNEPVTLIKHNYNAVLGVLRPKDQTKVLGKGGLKGDANGDGKIDVSDIAKIAAHIKGIKAIDKKYADNADVDGNGRVDVGDIAAVSAHTKGVKAIKQDKPVEKPKPVEKKEIVYVVRKGDTLSSIAAEYGTTWTKIAEDNNIENANLIYVGQKLVIK